VTSRLSSAEIIQLGEKYLMQTYRPLPLVIDRGLGARVIDVEGRTYIDFVAGIAVSSLGYGHAELARAIQEQAGKILHTSNTVYNEPSVRLAELLCKNSFAERVFFCNSGAEANDSLLKLARRVFFKTDPERCEIICMEKAFHGRTLGAISATGQSKYRDGFGPLLPGFKIVNYGDIAAMRSAFSNKTAAVIMEPILGEGGIIRPPPGYLQAVRTLCHEHGALLLFDEVQTGIGRTGKLFAYMHENVIPDAMVLAKGLGGGMPIGALLTTDQLGSVLEFPLHGSTFGCNPVATAAGLVVMKHVTTPTFLGSVCQMGLYLENRLLELKKKFGRLLLDVRGLGLFYGVECAFDTNSFRKDAFAKGLLINFCGHQVLRIAPPLVIDRASLDEGLDILTELLLQYNK
jgi:acetylornithine/N-succinyldiaminopimelate aminotransferase